MFKINKKRERQRPAPSNKDNYRSFSYYDSYRSENDSSIKRDSDKKLPKFKIMLNRLPGYFAFLLILISLFYLIWLDTTPKISIITEPGSATLLQDNSVYQNAAREALNKSVFNKTKITINTNNAAKELKSRFPEIADISISIPIAGHRLIYEIIPAKPVLIFNSNTYGSFVIDEEGRVVVETSRVADANRLALPSVSDETGVEAKIGNFVITKEEVGFINTLFKQIKAANRSVERIVMPKIAKELHLYLADKPYFIKFNINNDVSLQVGAMIAVEGKLESDGVTPLEYIDIRINGKAFYK